MHCRVPVLAFQALPAAVGCALALALPASDLLAGEARKAIAAASAQEAADPEHVFDHAYLSLRRGQHEAARAGFRQVISLAPASPYAVEAREHLRALDAARPRGEPRTETAATAGPFEAAPPAAAAAMASPSISAYRRSAAGSEAGGGARVLRQLAEEFKAKAGDRVFFSEGSADLGSRARIVLAAQADWLNRHTSVLAVVEGHADERGSGEEMMALAARRAEVVRTRLIEEGVPPERVRALAYGRERPLALCDDGTCRPQNRRVLTALEMRGGEINAVQSAAVDPLALVEAFSTPPLAGSMSVTGRSRGADARPESVGQASIGDRGNGRRNQR